MMRAQTVAAGALGLSLAAHGFGLALTEPPEVIETPANVQVMAEMGDSFADLAAASMESVAPASAAVAGSPESASPTETDLADPSEAPDSARAVGPLESAPGEAPDPAARPPAPDESAPTAPGSADLAEPPAPADTAAPQLLAAPAPIESMQTAQPDTTAPTTTADAAPVITAAAPVAMPEIAAAAPAATTAAAAPQPETLVTRPEEGGQVSIAIRPNQRPANLKIPPRPATRRSAPAQPRRQTTQQPRRQTQQAAPQRRASAGSGGGGGSTRQAAPAQASGRQLKAFYNAVRRKVGNTRVRAGRARGTAVIRFRISGGGGLASASVARSSGSSQLDNAALNAVRRAAPFPRPPAGANRTFDLPFTAR